MRDQEIHRALRDDPGVQPSPDFGARVMGAVRQEAAEQEALRFPWWLAAVGLAAVTVVLAGTWLLSPPGALQETASWVPADQIVRLGPWLVLALVSTFLPAWWTYRLATRW
jgi:hypothetical protein